MTSTDLLRIALPKGRLLDDVLALFAAAGCITPSAEEIRSRRLRFVHEGIEWILVKDCDVPVYVEHGGAHCGVAGIDQIVEQQSTAHRLVEFPFGQCRISVIGTTEGPALGNGSTVATKYPRIANGFLDDRGIHAEVVTLGGSVELAAVLGLTTHVVDLIQSGETIRANGLVEHDRIMPVAPWLVAGRDAYRTRTKTIRDLVSRIEENLHVPS